ncbi:S-layer homology domain-containing protein [Paenarthrobacter nitroguajacolicus]|uniref:S-layer homology domain-containing protein n=1 Tax=Paenarthrobacter nitroguajacolicus TaxID=211146 RepID=UPI00342D7424
MRGYSRGRFRLALTLLAALILGALPAGIASPAFAATTGSISGTVTVPAGVDVTKVTVFAGPEIGGYQTASVASDGTFTVSGLPAVNHWVNFSYFESPSPVVGAYYSTSPDGSRTLVSVSAGATTSGINQTLKPAAMVSGNISVPAGMPAFTGQVSLEAGPDYTKNEFVGSAWISADKLGNYTIGGLEAGTYKLRFASFSDKWATMWHGGVASAGSSPSVTVTEGQQLAGIQDSAVAAATIAGSIAGAPAPGPTMSGPGMSITAIAQDGTVAASTVMETSQTTYALKNLLPGAYKVQFNRTKGFISNYEAQLYKNLPESGGAANATPVTVAAGQTVSSVNATVRQGGTLTGKVLGSTGTPLNGVRVNVYTKDESLVTRFSYTAADGTFKVTGLTTGLYFVSAEPAGESGPIFSGNVLADANARSVSSFVGQNTDLGTLSYATATQGTRGFDDVPLGAQFQNEILWLANEGISTGWEANGSRTYQPLTPVNRDAMAAFMYRLSGEPEFTPPAVSPFADLPTDAKFYKEITWLAEKGISTGWEEADKTKTYRPLQPVNRDAMAAFMYRLAEQPEFTAPATSPFVDVPVGAQFYKEITWLAAQGISTGWAESAGKSFKPLLPVNRDAMAAFMFRFDAKFGAI